MKLLVLGASGRCGRWVTRLAAERGHQVKVLVRPAAVFEAIPGVIVQRGEALDPETLDAAVAGAEGVLSCLGLRRAGRNPWATLLSPPDLTTRVTRALISSMRKHGVRRLIAISAGGVGQSFGQLSRPVQWLVSQGKIAVAYRDLAGMETELARSGLDWLAVRPVTLAGDGPATGCGGSVARYTFTSIIRRADVAAWMLDAVTRSTPFDERTVLLGNTCH